jgi:phosphate transport system permease protein
MASRSDAPTPASVGLQAAGLGRFADVSFRRGMAFAAASVLFILAAMLIATVADSWPVFQKMGTAIVTSTEWDPGISRTEVTGEYGALAFIMGTLITSGIALVLAVPISVGISLYLTQVASSRIRRPLTYTIELLAAVPSVVYGLWGLLFFVPAVLKPVMNFIHDTFSFIPYVGTGILTTYNYFAAGVILSIMILPIITAVTREVMSKTPEAERHGAYALGATRWEMMRSIVLRRARPGIVGATMLGLGRALGETIAVAMLIGGSERIADNIFGAGQSMAGIIAITFQEAAPENVKALIAVGVVLFFITVIVNVVARLIVWATGGHVTGDAAV